MKLYGSNFHPYHTLYEQYLEYPIVVWPPLIDSGLEFKLIPNGTIFLNRYPASPGNYYLEWLDTANESEADYIQRTGRVGALNSAQLKFQFISEAKLFDEGLPQYYMLPAIAKTLQNTKLTFSGNHLAQALTKTGPYVLNLPDHTINLPDGRYISSVLVDFQSTKTLGMAGPEKYFLVLHYWWLPLPKRRHPGELKTDTSIIMIEPEQSLEGIFQEFERTMSQKPTESVSSSQPFGQTLPDVARNFGTTQSIGMQLDMARQFYALVIGSCIIISGGNEFITPVDLPIRKIHPKILVPGNTQTSWVSYPNNYKCPCFTVEESFRNHCKKRLSEQGILAKKNFVIGERFQAQAQDRAAKGITVPPHLQVYWHKKLPTGERVEEGFPVLTQKDVYSYSKKSEIPQDLWQRTRETRYRHKRIAKKMHQSQQPQLEPVYYEEAEPVETQIRDTAMVRWLKSVYDHTCQMCGYRITKEDGSGYSIGAHIMPFSEFPHLDIPENILILCPTHHDEFDLGIIWVDTDLFYWLRQQRMLDLESDPANAALRVPTEYTEGFTIKHRQGDKTTYSREVHDKTLMVIPPGSPRLPQGHCLNPFYFQYRFRKQQELETELGEMYRWSKIQKPSL